MYSRNAKIDVSQVEFGMAQPLRTVITPSDDTFVDQTSSSSRNGSKILLKTDQSPLRIIYLKFDLTSVTDKPFNRGTLRLRLDGNPSKPVLKLRKVLNNDWKENTVTYSTRPVVSDVVEATIGKPVADWISFDVTSILKETSSSVLSVSIKTNTSNGISLYSKESKNKPQLIIEHIQDQSTPTTAPVPAVTPVVTPRPSSAPNTSPTPLPTLPSTQGAAAFPGRIWSKYSWR
jgi:acid phosphatase type 7